MRAVHLFAGAGGSLLAGDLLGWEHLAAAELDPYCRAVLAARWPACELVGDVGTEPWERFAEVDLLVGGWPCQPVSSAGKRLASADHRDGWPGLARAIRLAQPRYLFLENVAAVLTAERGRYWGGCLADLAALGYGVRWTVLRASDAGAPHRRERLWLFGWLADAASERRGEAGELRCGEPAQRLGGSGSKPAGEQGRPDAVERGQLADSNLFGRERRSMPGGESAREPAGLAGVEGDHEGVVESPMGLRTHGMALAIHGNRLEAREGEGEEGDLGAERPIARRETLRDLRTAYEAEALRGETGGRLGLSEAPTLRPGLFLGESTTESCDSGGLSLASAEVGGGGVRGLRNDKETPGSPRRPEHCEQHPGEYSNLVQGVPRLLAHHGEEDRDGGGREDAAAIRLPWPGASGVWPAGRGQAQESWEPARTCGRTPLRRQQLKALGNGWVPAQAVLAWRILTEYYA